MLNVLLWLIAVEAIGLAAFPLCYYLFPRLKDRGYSVSKPFGILLIGYFSWILSVLHIMPSVQITVLGLLIVMGGVSGWYLWGRRREFWAFVVRERTVIVAAEILFLAVFLGWVVYRAYDPAINHTEQPMDLAMLNASIGSDYGAPEDPWLRGEAVSYYYFGYWMMGILSKLTAIPSYISYNLSLALIPAMAAMGIFGLVFNMVRSEAVRSRYAVMSGVAASVFLGIVANLEGVLEFLRSNGMGSRGFWEWTQIKLHATDSASEVMTNLQGTGLTGTWRPEEFWWWFRSSRVIDTFDGSQWTDMTIQEFPFFSLILGDLHPHVMSLPFVILFLAFAWSFLMSPVRFRGGRGIWSCLAITATALALGGLAFTNMWDLPVFSAMFLGIVVVKTYSARGGGVWTLLKGSVPVGLTVIGLAILMILPYLLTFRSQVSGIEPVVAATTGPVHFLMVWALFLVAVTPFILGVFWQTTLREDWVRLSLLSLLVGFSPYVVWAYLYLEAGGTSAVLLGRFVHVLPLALLIGIAVYSAMWLASEGKSFTGRVFALTLSALGLLLIMGPELLYVDDAFGGAWERMNTVFKLYYQAWILLAVASGFALYYWCSVRDSLSGRKRWLTTLWAGVFVVLLAGSLYYPLAAAVSKGDLFGDGATLDGLAYIARYRPAEYEAIRIVREQAGDDSAVLEAVGEWADAGLISQSTGVPNVVNWPGHEVQWRGSSEKLDSRQQDVATIYQTQDIEVAKQLLAKYRVDYVYVGPREREQYGTEGLGKFSSFMETLFSNDGVSLYRIMP